MQSDWRGEKRMTSAPKRAMSNRLEAVAISSMAQQARPMGIGHMEFVRSQLTAESSRVTVTSPSILLLYVTSGPAVTMCVKNQPKLPPHPPQARRFRPFSGEIFMIGFAVDRHPSI